jgi:hypothetical protein
MENFIFNDGGRKDAGYKGQTGDCVVRAIAIVTGKTYQEVYDAINVLSESKKFGHKKVKTKYGTSYKKVSASRTGVVKKVYGEYLESLGYHWIPTMGIGTGCKIHLKGDELPKGRLIVRLSRHICAVIDGVVNDTYDGSREGTRCVYGYFKKDTNNSK